MSRRVLEVVLEAYHDQSFLVNPDQLVIEVSDAVTANIFDVANMSDSRLGSSGNTLHVNYLS